MRELTPWILFYVPLFFELLGVLVVISTVAVRFTTSKSDDKKMKILGSRFFKYMSYMPTFGINPRTKLLEEMFKDINESGDK